MKKIYVYLSLVLVTLLFSANVLAQNQLPGSWKVYDNSNTTWANLLYGNITLDNLGNAYVQSSDGVVKFDGDTGTQFSLNLPYVQDSYGIIFDYRHNCFWSRFYHGIVKSNQNSSTLFTVTQFGMTDNLVSDIAIDSNGNVWFTASTAFVKFNGNDWTTVNFPIPWVKSVAFSSNGDMWCASSNNGVAKFNGSIWTVYNTGNSQIPHDHYYTVKCSPNGDVWFYGNSSYGQSGLVKFDGTNWYYFNTSSGLPYGLINYIDFTDGGNTVWASSNGGLSKYDGVSWITYTTLNSSIPSAYINYDGYEVGAIKSTPNNHLYMFISGKFSDFNPSDNSLVGQPTNLTATIESDSISVNWDSSTTPEATYTVLRLVKETNYLWGGYQEQLQSIAGINSVAYTEKNIDSNKIYSFAVYAEKDNYFSRAIMMFDVNSIYPPSNIIAEKTSGVVKITWNHSLTPNVKYAIFRRDNYSWYGETLNEALSSDLTDSVFVDSTVMSIWPKTYYYTVFAYKGTLCSDYMLETSVAVDAYSPTISLELINNQDKGYRLNWEANTVPGLLYNVYRREEGDTNDIMIHQLDADSTGYSDILSDTNLDKEYYYFIKPQMDTAETGGKSNEVFTADIKDSITLEITYYDKYDSTIVSCDSLMRNQDIRCRIIAKNTNGQILPGVKLNINNNSCENGVCQNLTTDSEGKYDYNFKVLEYFGDESIGSGITEVKEKIVSVTTNLWTKTKKVLNKAINILPDKTYDIGFRPNKNGFSFSFSNSNNNRELWDIDINCDNEPYTNQTIKNIYYQQSTAENVPCGVYPDWNLWVNVFGNNQCYENDSLKISAVEKWAQCINRPEDNTSTAWNGECYGFCTSSLLKYIDEGELPSTGNCYSLTISQSKEWIGKYNQYQFGQKQEEYRSEINNLYNTNNTSLRRMVDTLVKAINEGKNSYRILGISANNNPANPQDPSRISHAVVPYKIERRQAEDKIYVYDPNPTYHDRILTISIDNNGNETMNYRNTNYSTYATRRIVPSIKIIEYNSIPQIPNSSNRISEPNINFDLSKFIPSVYPNPTDDFINISFNSLNNESVKIEIFSSLGLLINSQTFNVDKNSLQIKKIDCSSFTPGLYICKLLIGDATYCQSFIVR